MVLGLLFEAACRHSRLSNLGYSSPHVGRVSAVVFRINEAVLRLVFTVRETGGAGGWLRADKRCVQRPGGAAEEQISTLCGEHNPAGKVKIIINA